MKILKALVLALMALLILTRSEGFASAEWIEVDASGNIPEGSIVVGCDDGSSRDMCATPVYVCRGMIEGTSFTGKTGQGWGFCNIERDGQEHQVTPHFVLHGRVNGYAQAEAGGTITADKQGLFTQEQLEAAVAAGKQGLFTQEQLEAAVAAGKKGLFTQEQLEAAVAAGKQGLGTHALLHETRAERPPGGQFCSRNCREAGRLLCPQPHLSDICHGVSAIIMYSRQGSENAEDIVQAWSLKEPSKRRRLESTCKDAGVPLPESGATTAGKQGLGTHALLHETRAERPPGQFCSRNCREAGRLQCPQHHLSDICHGVSAIFTYSRQGSENAEDIVQAWSLKEPSKRRRLESTCKDAGVPLPEIR